MGGVRKLLAVSVFKGARSVVQVSDPVPLVGTETAAVAVEKGRRLRPGHGFRGHDNSGKEIMSEMENVNDTGDLSEVGRTKVPLGEISIPSTDIVDERIVSDGDLTISYEFFVGDVRHRGGVLFRKVRAFRKRAEGHCTLWYIDGVYDTVAEVIGSRWVAELIEAQPAEQRHLWEIHHFMLYLDPIGCVEAAAESWELLPDEPIV